MYAAAALDREVAPHIWGVSEAQFVNAATGRLETIICIF